MTDILEVILSPDIPNEDFTDSRNPFEFVNDGFGAATKFHQQVLLIKNQTDIEGKATAYMCENYACKESANDIAELKSYRLQYIKIKDR